MRIELMFPSKYLRGADFQGKDVVLTIKKVALEDLQEVNGGTKKKGIITFHETDKALVLNRTNALCVSGMFGPETDAWVGRKICLYPAAINDPFTGEKTLAIRVRGSPELAANKQIEIRLPRKNPIKMTMQKTGNGKANGKAASKAPAPPPEPPAAPMPDYADPPDMDPETGEVPF